MSFLFVIINTINFLLLVVAPLAKRSSLFRLLHKHRDNIRFTIKLDWVDLPTLDQIKNRTADYTRYVECRIDIGPDDYIVWKIWEDGTLVKYLNPKKTRWINRECVVQFTRRKMTDSDPLSSLAARFEFMKYEVKRVWPMGWLTRKYLEHITAEPYVMAKLTGIELDDPLDIGG